MAHLSKAGLVTRVSRGRYKASERGAAVLAKPPERITMAYLSRYPEFVAFRAAAKVDETVAGAEPTASATAAESSTPQERFEAADKALKAELAATLLARLQTLDPTAFEQLIIDVLVGMGYGGTRRDAAARLGRSGDGGIDGVIREDALGLDTIYLQAKRYAEDNAVGAPAIQGFAGALLANGATKGVFVTTGRFTQQARDMGAAYGKTHRIVLIDGRELAQLMIEHEVGVRTVQTVKVQRIDLDDYEAGDLG